MAVKNRSGERCTPKQRAAEDLLAHLDRFTLDDDDVFTDKERELVTEQVNKYKARLLKVLGGKAADEQEGSVSES